MQRAADLLAHPLDARRDLGLRDAEPDDRRGLPQLGPAREAVDDEPRDEQDGGDLDREHRDEQPGRDLPERPAPRVTHPYSQWSIVLEAQCRGRVLRASMACTAHREQARGGEQQMRNKNWG
ncbi:MAG TPA: hypothetical protein VHS35_25810 [Pseudonocardia sp.]|nr:hypothetical protein [Pseudonocardia sp.]